MKKQLFLFVALLFVAVSGPAQTVIVEALGASKGWYSDDTRDAYGANLVGTTLTHYGKSGQTPTAADDAAIAQQVSFGSGPGGVGALKMDKASTSGGYSKCTISKLDPNGLATGDSWLSTFKLDYSYNTTSTAEYTVPKITIRSSNWSASQTGFTATRSGESAWDIILVDWRGSGSGWTVNTWNNVSTDKNTVCWAIYDQAGNAYYTPPGGSTIYSLQQIKDNATWGPIIFGVNAKVVGVQLGVGSSNQTSTSFIDYIETNLLNSGNRVDFNPPPAPITTIVASTSSPCGTLDVDVKVSDFKNVANVSLVLNYDATKLAYQSVDVNSLLTGYFKNGTIAGQFRFGRISITNGVTLNAPDDVLFTLHFNIKPAAVAGNTDLKWSTVPLECQFSGGGSDPIIYTSTFSDGAAILPVRPVKNTTTLKEYCTIQAAIDDPLTSDGHTITVAAGNYPESIDITKALTILGAGQTTTFIDQSANAAAGNVVSIHGACGSVKVDGFTIKTGTASSVACNGISISGLTTPGTITLTNNTIWGNQSAVKDNLCLIAGYFSITTPKLVFDHNIVHGGWSSTGVANPILIEKWMGSTEITNNTIDYGTIDRTSSDVIVFLNNAYGNVAQKQLISRNTLDMGWGTTYDASHRGAGITFWSGYDGSTSAAGYSNVEISDNTFLNLKPSRQGISLYNSSGGDGSGGNIANAVISGNTISNASGYSGEFGIRVRGKATGTQISNNLLSGVNDAVLIAAQSGHEPSLTYVTNNSLLATTGKSINNATSATIAGTCNWFGANSLSGVAAKISGPVTYSPWLINGTDVNDPGFVPGGTCTGATDLYVNDGVFGGNDIYTSAAGNDANPGTAAAPFLTISKAVSVAMDGTTIKVDAGTFQEQVSIGKSVNIVGNDKTKTKVLAPVSLTSTPINIYSPGEMVNPILYVYGNSNTVNISKISIDGDNGRTVNKYFGVLYNEANGTFTENRITAIHDAGSFSGAQAGVAFYAGHIRGTTLAQEITFTNNIVDDYQKGGVVVDAAGTHGVIDNNQVTGQNVALVTAQNGIQLSRGAYGSIQGNTLTNNIWNKVEHPHTYTAAGILLYQAGITTVTGNTFNGNELGLSSSGSTGVTYGVNTFNNNKIHLWLDAAGDVNAGNIYDKKVLNLAMLDAVFGCIQYAVDEASTGNTLNASAGTFIENVSVHTSVIINGAGMASTFVIPAISAPNPGLAISLPPGASNIFLVQANDVTIQNLTADGNNPSITSGMTSNSIDVDARNGIITDHNLGVYGNLNVNNVTVKNIYLRGMYASSRGSFNFNNNTVTNVAGSSSSIAMFNFGGSGAFTNNTVSLANDAIASNHSSGTTYSGNTVTNSGSGIHTDNQGDGGGTADVIENNTISNSPANGYGIFVFSAYKNVLVQKNTITNVEVGLTCAGSYSPSAIPVFTQNTVDGQMKNNSIGVYSTTEIWGHTSGNQNVVFTNNFIKNNVKGFMLASELGFTNTTRANENSITGNTTGVKLVKDYNEVPPTGSFSLNMECNWWGATAAAAVATAVGATDPPVDYTPWLTNETDFTPAIAGFQLTANSCGGTPIVIASAVADNIICGESSGSIAVTFSGGTAPYNITWTGGTATGIASPYTITSLPAGVYSITITDANLSEATSNATVLYLPVTNISSLPNPTYYPTIQAAIDVANTGNVITVCAGTYAEDIIVNKSVTILGPNATIEPCSGTRVKEAIVVPKTKAIASGEIFHVAASNVTIKGFTIDGDNLLLASGFSSTTSADIDAAKGITVYETGINNLTVINNILKNLSYFGVTLYDPAGVPSSGHVISNNKFQDLGTYDATSGGANRGGGVLLYNNQYAAVANNCMNNVRLGIQTGNFYQANPGTAASQLISGNTIQARKRGVFHNLFYSSASPYTISNNIITGLANVNETTFWDGILLASMQQTASTASGNIIDGSAVTALPKTGIAVWNCQVAPLISGGTISGVGLGINVNNFESYPSINAGNTSATIDGVAISGTTIAGVKVHDNPLNTIGATVSAEIKNVVISGTNATGILVSGADAGANIHDNTITASTAGISVTGTSTSSTVGLSIANNTINLASQLAGSNPTVGIALSKVTGIAAATISSNTISGSYYGYLVYNLNTLPKTTITGGTITGVMQGVSVINIDPATLAAFAPSTLGVSDIALSNFAGNHAALPNSNFHAGVYVFTGGAVDGTGITATVDKVVVNGTGKIAQDCAGLSFADFTTNAVNMQNITVTECTLTNNLNRGINIRGKNALVNIGTSTLTGNGSDAYGTGGNDGFGIVAFAGANATVHNCFITNPASSTSTVSALCTFPYGTPELGGTITASENWLSRNGNTTSWLANNGGGTLNATCNWWNTTTPSNALIAATINGVVTYSPWLTSGGDGAGAGFQPTGLCDGTSVIFNCGVNVTVAACSTQEQVDAAYLAFKNSTKASGCSGLLTNNAPATAPSICGGSVDVTWTYANNCELKSCTRTFTVTAAPTVSLTCPVNITVASCQDQTTVDAAYAAWLLTASASGGCNGAALTNNSTGAPSVTGGTKTVVFTYTSTCAPLTTTCNATFAVAAKNTLSGTLVYNNSVKTPMNEVTIGLFYNPSDASPFATKVTANGGQFSFPDLCTGEYTIKVTGTNNVAGGVNSTDAGAANAWGVTYGTDPIQHVKFLAGDVTFNKIINNDDALAIMNYFVYKTPFAVTTPVWSYWKKVSGNEIIKHNENPYDVVDNLPAAWPTDIKVTVNGDVTNLELYGMFTGDFNGDRPSSTLKSASISSSSLTLTQNGIMDVGTNKTFELPIIAASEMQVGAVSMILQIPSELVTVMDVVIKGSTAPVSWAVKGDELRIGWYSLNPFTVAEKGSLVTLNLKTTNKFKNGQSIDLVLTPDPLNELADGKFNVYNSAKLQVAKIVNGKLGKSGQLGSNGLQGVNLQADDQGLLLGNYPNPFRNTTTVTYTLPVNGKVTLDLFGLTGQLVTSLVDETQANGQYSIQVDSSNLMQGTYLARLVLIGTDGVTMEATVKLIVLN